VGILDFLFPKTCVGCGAWGQYLCLQCTGKIQYLNTQFCPQCAQSAIGGRVHPKCQRNLGLDGLISLTFFGFPINKLIYRLKYQFTTDLVRETVEKIKFEKNLLPLVKAYLLPAPLHRNRQNERGFNQSLLLGKIYAQELEAEFKDDLLEKVVKTKPQVGLKRQERLANLKGVFSLKGEVEGSNCIVFDDVWTSGATLKNIGELLKRNGAREVWGFTLARSR
jgi:ComF family protein